jgi:hypothetical protein
MVMKLAKGALWSACTLGLVGGLIFGRDAVSYVTSSARSIQSAVKDTVPVEFQLRRARDLVNDIIPEMHANIRLIAQQEVEIDALKKDIDESKINLRDETAQIQKLRDGLASDKTSLTFGQVTYTRDQVKEDLARRLENVREAELVLTSKQRLLDNQGRALAAASQALERTRSQKSLLESQIAALDGQNRLLQASAVGSTIQVDNSKLAQSERLIAEVKKQLDVSERVLARESRFTQPIAVDAISEGDVMKQAEEFLASAKK